MSKRKIEFTATSCVDCEFAKIHFESDLRDYCGLTNENIYKNVASETFHKDCPMGQIVEDKNETNR